MLGALASGPALLHVEFFSGEAAITRAMREACRQAASFDVRDEPVFQNMLTSEGFVLAMLLVLRLVPGAGMLAAPVCSTWVWLNRGTSLRSSGRRLGDTLRQQVRDANCMVARVVLLAILTTCRGLVWIIEQPANSLLEKHPRFQLLLSRMPVYRITTYMQAFGGPSLKPTWLYSNSPLIDELARKPSGERSATRVEMVKACGRGESTGRIKYTGGDDLKESQTYPREFGLALVEWYTRHRAHFEQRAKDIVQVSNTAATIPCNDPLDSADDARLGAVLEYAKAMLQP